MLWKIKILFYLSFGFLLIGFIFPTHVSQAIGFDIGEMVHWICGFYIVIPRNPSIGLRIYFNFNGIFLLIFTVIFIIVSYTQLHNANSGKKWEKNSIYIFALLQLIFTQFYINSGYVVTLLSISGFSYSAFFAFMGNKELKLHYSNNGIVNTKIDSILGVILIILGLFSTIYTVIISIFWFDYPYVGTWYYIFPGIILQLLTLIYGIYLLQRAIRYKNTKT